MSTSGSVTPHRRSAVQWFSCAAAALLVTAAVGAYGLAWLVRTERQPQSAFLPLSRPIVATYAIDDVDGMATGSVRPTAKTATQSLSPDR